MTTYVDFYMEQGATFNKTIVLTNDETNAAINIAGYTFLSQMRKSYESENASANLTCTITSNAGGILALSMVAANTSNLESMRYVYDVKATDTSNVVSRVIEGTITVTSQASRT